MGDFKPKSELRARLPKGIRLGIENHRLVDRLTDQFQPVKNLRGVFSKRRRRYAGIISDIAFDYFLIKHWRVEEDGQFEDFIENCYCGLAQCERWMPPRMALVVGKMREHRWLAGYASLRGIGHSIDAVSRRMRFSNELLGGVEEVKKNYAEIEAVYLQLFAHLKREIEQAAIEVEELDVDRENG